MPCLKLFRHNIDAKIILMSVKYRSILFNK